jgi:hypothetical protein
MSHNTNLGQKVSRPWANAEKIGAVNTQTDSTDNGMFKEFNNLTPDSNDSKN